MQSPLTIVIPVYNRAHTIWRTLRSIENQTVMPAQVILVDNGSNDASLSIINAWASKYGKATVLTESRRGACHARNRGLCIVQTEWTMFFDSDDEMLPTHIEEFSRAIADNPQADVIGRDIIMQTLGGSRNRLYFRSGKSAMFHHLFRGCMSTQRFIARTSIFHNVGKWNEKLTGWNDFELGVKILLNTHRVVILSGTPTVIVYQQEQSITGTNFSSHPERWEDSLEAIRLLFTRMPDSSPDKSRYISWLEARAMILAARYEHESRAMKSGSQESVRAQALSVRLYDRIISATRHPIIMRIIYRHNLIFSRLTWVIARILLR